MHTLLSNKTKVLNLSLRATCFGRLLQVTRPGHVIKVSWNL